MITIARRIWWRGDEFAEQLRRANRDAVRECAEFIAERARFHCPVRTGRLRDSIVVESSMGGVVWNVLVTAPYAKAVEFGHLQGSTWIAPRPFLRTARAEGMMRFPDILRHSLVTARSGEHLGATMRAAA